MRKLLLAAAFLLLPSAAWAACSTTVSAKDGAGATKTLCAVSDGGSNLVPGGALFDTAGAQMGVAANPLQVSLANNGANATAVKVDGSAATQPISGSVGQSGTWTVQPGNTANTTAWKVDGSAVTQPVSAATLPLPTGAALEAGNLATLVTDSGAPGATACATDTSSCNFNQLLQRLAQRLTTINTTLGSPFQAGAALAANQSVNVAQIAGTATVADPCQTVAKTYTPISITANTKIVTGTSAKKTYVCAINITAPNTNVALVEGTGTACATGTVGVAGGATAATGWNFANATAPGVGITQGNGTGAIMATATNADDLCLFVSAANQVSGQIATVQQ